MPASNYLLYVNSRPTGLSDKLWTEWYTTEHLPDLVNSNTSTRAAFYEEIPTPLDPNPSNPRKFLALYQTDFEECLKTPNYTNLRTTSELFKKEGGTERIGDNGDFDARNYHLIQEYDPKKIGEVPPPQLLTVEMHPGDEDDFDKWYREEHLILLSKLPGYRRSLRYKLGPRTPLTKGDDPPPYLALHEMDDLKKGIECEEFTALNATPWTEKQRKESKNSVVRGWKLVHPEGY